MKGKWLKRRKRLFEIIEVGNDLDHISRSYDYINAIMIVINLVASIMYTYETLREAYGFILLFIEGFTVLFFALDYVLRVWTARFLYPDLTEGHAIRDYVFVYGNYGFAVIFTILFTDFHSHRDGRISYDKNCTNLSFV